MSAPWARPTRDDGAPSWQHASADAYAAFVRARLDGPTSVSYALGLRDRFVRAYPDLRGWFHAPLADRVGRLYGEANHRAHDDVSYRARPYLYFLALRGVAQFDWEWLIAVREVALPHEKCNPRRAVASRII